ncbi:MAG TPA: hypothetical protein VHP14_08095 [Anaerolineales bacterium]|nr:hypothetical protein [Anaerolineales bacterium]
MNLIDKYIAEVGKHLPRRNRADIEAEIRSTLEDMLEERKQAQGQMDDGAISELLKEYGAPRKVAESYVGPRYLVGPRMYPFFEMVTRIVFIVLIAITLIGVGISLVNANLSGPEVLKTIGSSLLSLLGGLMTAFGNIVLVFAILERVLPKADFEKELEDWDPKELASEPDPDRLGMGEQIVSIFFTVLFLVVLNLYPNLIGIGFFSESHWTFITPVLTKAFFNYMPWINILALLQIGFHVYLLRRGSWNIASRVANIVLELADIALAAVMLRGPALVAMTPAQFAGTPLADEAEFFANGANWLPTLVLAVVIFAGIIEIVEMINHLLKNRQTPPYPVIK